MFEDLIEELSDNSQTTKNFVDSINYLCFVGKDWENVNRFASYYVVHSLSANSVSLMLGDVRFRTSYSSVITLILEDNGRFALNTIAYDNFPDETYEVRGELGTDLVKKCLSSTYCKNVVRNILASFSDEKEDCKIQVRTGIFWSETSIVAEDCQKIFKSIGNTSSYFTFSPDANFSGPVDRKLHLSHKFMKQTNRIALNGIQFSVKIRKNTINFEVLNEDGRTKVFRDYLQI
jgi:hypothetical protein